MSVTCSMSLINRCNLHCPMCAAGGGVTGEAGMPMEDVINIYDQLVEASTLGTPVTAIELSGSGEPLLNKDLVPSIVEGKKRGFRMEINTNCLLLGEKMAKDLLASEVDLINCSIVGVTNEVYRHFQGGGLTVEKSSEQMALVKDNILRLIELRNKINSRTRISVFYILNPKSMPELRDALLFWGRAGVDNVMTVSDYQTYPQYLQSTIPSQTNRCQVNANWTVTRRGDFGLCQNGVKNGNCLGNVFETSIKDMILSAKCTNIKQQLANIEEGHVAKACQMCTKLLIDLSKVYLS